MYMIDGSFIFFKFFLKFTSPEMYSNDLLKPTFSDVDIK